MSRFSEHRPAESDWNSDQSDWDDLGTTLGLLQGTRGADQRFSDGSGAAATLHVGCTCSARVACALCRRRAYWRDWGVDWPTGSKHFDSTETRRRCSDSSWESREHLRQQRGCTSPSGRGRTQREGQTSYSVGRINWLPAVRVEPWTKPRKTPTSGDRTHSGHTPQRRPGPRLKVAQ